MSPSRGGLHIFLIMNALMSSHFSLLSLLKKFASVRVVSALILSCSLSMYALSTDEALLSRYVLILALSQTYICSW